MSRAPQQYCCYKQFFYGGGSVPKTMFLKFRARLQHFSWKHFFFQWGRVPIKNFLKSCAPQNSKTKIYIFFGDRLVRLIFHLSHMHHSNTVARNKYTYVFFGGDRLPIEFFLHQMYHGSTLVRNKFFFRWRQSVKCSFFRC